MEELNLIRLRKEVRDWRADKPHVRDYVIRHFQGFNAKPIKNEDGTLDLSKWNCDIPGPKDSPWEGGVYKLTLTFPSEYPALPPRCVFKKKLFHPNVYPSGSVCLSIINEEEDWRPTLKVKDILLGIQDLLKHPNEKSPAQKEAYNTYISNQALYNETIRNLANECKPSTQSSKRKGNKHKI